MLSSQVPQGQPNVTDNSFVRWLAVPTPFPRNPSDYLDDTSITAPLDPHRPDDIPMEIDLIHRDPVTSQEEDRLLEEWLCLYWGQVNHFVMSWPNTPPELGPACP